jgi:dihydroorotate dehydrogenase
MLYKLLIRPLLFKLEAEKAHKVTFGLLKAAGKMPGFLHVAGRIFKFKHPNLERTVAGLTFLNPVGLAAGFDKDGKAFHELGAFGFGFIEVGTVTPEAQSGNPKPRLFRLIDDRAIINRMGFNNEGVEALKVRLKNRPKNLIVGGNIGKNKSTANENAVSDYLTCFEELFPWVDYFAVNISSPNTPGLRELQEKEPLLKLLGAISDKNHKTRSPKPVFLKIAPDLSDPQLDEIIEIVKETKLSGMIISNTTISREPLITDPSVVTALGAGGLSGAPLFERSTAVLRYVVKISGKAFAIIASGGIESGEDAAVKLKAGADLVQVYTGFIYEGPSLIKRINKYLASNL